MARFFFYLHMAGLALLSLGIFLIFRTENALQDISNLLWISICIGLGLMLISPWPVVKAITWMKNNGD